MEIIRNLFFVIVGVTILRVAVPFIRFLWKARWRRSKDDNYRYISVEDDGTAREVTSDEKEYLETKFLPGDGARPYIKSCYEEANGWGSMSGFLPRRQLPKNIPIVQVSSKPD